MSAEIQKPPVIVVISGIIISTMATLMILPVLYALISLGVTATIVKKDALNKSLGERL